MALLGENSCPGCLGGKRRGVELTDSKEAYHLPPTYIVHPSIRHDDDQLASRRRPIMQPAAGKPSAGAVDPDSALRRNRRWAIGRVNKLWPRPPGLPLDLPSRARVVSTDYYYGTNRRWHSPMCCATAPRCASPGPWSEQPARLPACLPAPPPAAGFLGREGRWEQETGMQPAGLGGDTNGRARSSRSRPRCVPLARKLVSAQRSCITGCTQEGGCHSLQL